MGDADLGAVLEKIADRLDRLERKMDAMSPGAPLSPRVAETLDRVVDRLPLIADAVAGTAQTVWNEAEAAGIDPIALLEATIPVMKKSARPEVVALVSRMVDPGSLTLADRLLSRLDQASGALDRLDALETKLVAARVDTGALADRGVDIAVRLAQVAQGPEANALVKGPAFDAPTLDLLGKLAEATNEVRSQPIAPVGLFGALSAMGKPDVQRAVGFALAIAARLGAKLG
jgi:hypothetical protein